MLEKDSSVDLGTPKFIGFFFFKQKTAYEIERERQEAELSSARRDQVKSGGRSDKIRTYNYKENRVTDHRIGLTLHSLDHVLAGQLDDLTDALMADERQRQLGDEA